MNWDEFTTILLKLLAVGLLVFLNAFFVAAEFAFVKLRGTQVEGLAAKGHRGARVALRLARNLDACISATQVGITLCGLATGALVKPVFHALLLPMFEFVGVTSSGIRNGIELLVGFLVSTFLLIVVGELVPKSLAIRKTVTVSLWTGRPLEWFYRLTYPFIWVLNHSAQWCLERLGIAAVNEAEQGHSEEELRLLFSAAADKSGGCGMGRSLVLNAFEIRHRIAREVMRPRREMVVLDTRAGIQECLDIAERTRFSRFPLCEEGDLDRTLGVVHIKDLYLLRSRIQTAAELRPVMRKMVYVGETARLGRLLEVLLERRLHLAVVVDEYGGTVGMVSLENILEELVGQIQDEFDQERPLVVAAGDQVWDLDGILPLHELAVLVGEPLREEGITTVSGWVSRRLGGFPKVGDELVVGQYGLRVEAVDGVRVTRLRLARQAPAPSVG
ncbi:MAG TPA: hemolysin family protein [Verrucomicrobiota bacterium]|nr:hemolysin family protein [Verrucomicrobiota bacterium]HNU50094.1 hemolysin family protein [Verrucomicrobiota bacterium]